MKIHLRRILRALLLHFQHKYLCTDPRWMPEDGNLVWKGEACQLPHPDDTPDVAPRKEWSDGVSTGLLLSAPFVDSCG